MMNGIYNGRIAVINLTEGSVNVEPLPEDLIRERIGGALINLYLYDKYSDFEPVVLGTGPLTGTMAPASSLMAVTAKSPLTGTTGHIPVMWHIGAEAKFSGFDYIVLCGRSQKPLILWCHDEIAELIDAHQVRELDVSKTVEHIRKELGDDGIQVLTTGIAGRKGIPVAMLSENYWGSRDTLGFGRAFGEKNILAVAFRGLGSFQVKEELFMSCMKLKNAVDKPGLAENCILKLMEAEGYSEKLIRLVESSIHRSNACFNCGFPCYAFVKFREDPRELRPTREDAPGTTILNPFSVSVLYKKFSEKLFKILEQAQSLGIEPGLAGVLLENKDGNNLSCDELLELSSGKHGDINAELIKGLRSQSPERAALSELGVLSSAVSFSSSMREAQIVDKLEHAVYIQMLSLITGICPVFLDNRKGIGAPQLEGILAEGASFMVNLKEKAYKLARETFGRKQNLSGINRDVAERFS